MKTIILDRPGSLRLIDSEPPGPPTPGQAVVRVRRVGICGTDLHAFEGRQNFFTYPRILGHELAVEVVALDPGLEEALAVGDRCTVYPYASCGRCIACRRGKPNCCTNLEVLGVHVDGGMREFIALPADKLYPANHLPLEHLALVEMLGVGAHAVWRAGLEPQETVLVIGAGPVGLAIIVFAQFSGARVLAMEVDESRMTFCRRQLGIKDIIDASDDPLGELARLTSGDLPTAVFDATGNGRSMAHAFAYTAFGGRLIFVGHFPDEPVMPGVLLVEALAQSGGLLVLSSVDKPEKYSTYFLKIDKLKFKQKVVPGDTVILKMELIEPIRRGIVAMYGQAFVGNTLVVEGEMVAQVIKNK